MHDIFISYKSEDEAHAARLAKALEASGLSVWWDRSLVSGENWRGQIQDALDAARCVIVIWTKQSSGPEGDFVRDEASQGKARGVLVPVMMQKTRLPLGFGELQYIDLIGWRGSTRNAFFRDLVGAVRAKIDGTDVPKPIGPGKRFVRRLFVSATSTSLLGAAAMFGANTFSVQDRVCSAPFLQPNVSDMCGGWGMGDKPSRQERLAWAALPAGDCNALRDHVDAFPHGVYRDDAADMITAARLSEEEVWTPAVRPLALYVSATEAEPAEDEAAARTDAQSDLRAGTEADRTCRGFAVAQSYKYIAATYQIDRWVCRQYGGGVVCGFDGQALCKVEERSLVRTETCGGGT